MCFSWIRGLPLLTPLCPEAQEKCELLDRPVRLPWYIHQRNVSVCLPQWIMLSDPCQQHCLFSSASALRASTFIVPYLWGVFSLWIIPNYRLPQFSWGSMVQRRLRTLRRKHDVLCVFVQPSYQLCHTYASGALKGKIFWLLFKAPLIYCFCINNDLQAAAFSEKALINQLYVPCPAPSTGQAKWATSWWMSCFYFYYCVPVNTQNPLRPHWLAVTCTANWAN